MTSGINLGFIGTGGITSAIVTGLCTAEGAAGPIWVSPRNQEKARELKERFEQVQVGQTNQEVLDNAEIVVLAFLPQQKEEILPPLTFREDQAVVNLLAGIPVSNIVRHVAPPGRSRGSSPCPAAPCISARSRYTPETKPYPRSSNAWEPLLPWTGKNSSNRS